MPKKYSSKLTKTVAYKKLQDILLRLTDWNELHSYYYKIEEVALVGSLARGGDRFGDIDLCIKTKHSREFSHSECKNDYIKWREQVLGYKSPESYSSAELYMFERDVSRFIKNRDGRIETLRWDQFQVICLTLRLYIKLVEKGSIIVDTVEDLESHRATFSKEQALEIVNNGVSEKPMENTGIYWDSYCSTLKLYPEFIRNAILDRDSYREDYCVYSSDNT